MASDPSPFRAKDQLGLAVNPANPDHVVAVTTDYLTETCQGTASFDGGSTWTHAATLEPPAPGLGLSFLSSCRIANHLGESTFQTVAFGTGNNVYATTNVPRVAVGGGEQGAGTVIYKSTDGGVTWNAGVVAMAGGPANNSTDGPYYELPTVAVDPGAGTGGADLVYSAARDVSGSRGNSGPPCPVSSCPSARVARSLDGAQTFGPDVQASPPGVPLSGPDGASQPVIGADGSVSIAWRTLRVLGPPVVEDEIQVARSTDQGQTWSAPVSVADVSNLARLGNSHLTPNVASGSSFPRLAGDRRNGNLYIVYGQGAPGPTAPAGGFQGADHFIAPDSRVYFQRSLDNGATWSTPERINDVTTQPGTPTVQTRHPTVSVASNGRVDIVWEDRRHWYQAPAEQGAGERKTGDCLHTHIACDDARLGDTYYAYSTNRGASFSRNIRINDRSHNNDVGYDYRFGVGWGFGPQVVAMGADKALIGWMDSREGNFDNDNLDIYLAKVDLDAPAAAAQSNVTETDPVALSLALSKRAYAGGGESVLTSTFATRSATKVVIVNKDDTAGALAASVLARANLATVLLSPAGGLPAAIKAEVARLNPTGAYVIGDTGKLSAQVVADLVDTGIDAGDVDRVSGAGDAGNAAAMAPLMDNRTDPEKAAGVPAFDAVVIANPAGPDAVAASALASARRLPIMYVSTGAVPAATSAALASLNIDKTLVIGDTGQVGSPVAAGLPSPTRLGGADQYATSKAVVDEGAARGLPDNIVYVADGARPMDAALLGAAVGRETGTMVLARAPLASTAASTASAASLFGIDQLVLVAPVPPPVPPPVVPVPPPAPILPPPPAPVVAGALSPAKMSLARATMVRAGSKLDVLAPITSRASGDVKVELHAAGRRTRFTSKIDSSNGRIRFRQSIPSSQARLGTGIVTIDYAGDADTQPQTVRLRAAINKAQLRLSRPTIKSGRLQAKGTVSSRARGVVRLQVQFVVAGKTIELAFRGRISGGRWSIDEKLPAEAQAQIARRTGVVHSYTLFTGYLPARMRGEMRSFQILGDR